MIKRAARQPSNGAVGPPRLVFDIETAKRAASIGCTSDEIAAVLGIARSSYYNHLNDDPSLREALDEAAANGKATLRRLQWQRASQGSDTMLIWLGKQLLGQTDRQELTGKDGGPLSYVVRAPTPVESADEWLRQHAPANLPSDSTLLDGQAIPSKPPE